MKRILILHIIILMLGSLAQAQEQLNKRQQADLLFNRYQYYNAARLYSSLALKKNPDVKLLERLATCYRKMNNYEAAEKWYALAVADPKAELLTHYYYAEALLSNQKFEAAKAAYQTYGARGGAAAEVALKTASCDSAAVWLNQPSRYTVNNAKALNSKYADWGLGYGLARALVFTSERPADSLLKYNDIYRWNGNPWLKLFSASPDGKVINELPVLRKAYSSFITDYHVGPMVLNSTEDTAYVTIATRAYANTLPVDQRLRKNDERLYTRRLELIIAVKTDGRWGYLKDFPYNNVKAYSLGNAALAKNGNVLYFTSDMPGGMGKTDIWFTEKQPDGSWGKPLNCGPAINTAEEESFPTIGAQGELYYSSKGKTGMGGYDIYTSTGEKASWSVPLNLKYPVNTTYDDFYFSTADGLTGYLSSNRRGGLGDDDIYSFSYKAPKVVKPEPQKPVDTIKYEVGKTYVLKDIYYDFDKSNIRLDAAKELDKLVTILNEHPAMHIELGSHTDSRGNDDYNLRLSQRRAESAVAYLISKGIERGRLSARGYGETMLVNSCSNGVKCSEAEHQANRRTEFKVTKTK
ncbi:OmpA family protein [Pedobacter africanus]|uniref:Outer membrane protein OmpA n=1 Tax=Pedobacter africanus TaxID=151894 RepID=A0A1W2EEL0_9SPHI|nr:OmpA family protein [Pedobacter africanus]SMD08159.1 Outer membrane protein OmpA [Pedobacter africanus]